MIIATKIDTATTKAGISEKEGLKQWLAGEVESSRLIPPESKFDIGSIDISKDKRIERETWWPDYEFARSDRF
jgi:hypothetical protein